ncbi:MAG TPA: MBG domain-containing protein [Terriglobales bacterium]|nr:MBG domain-containing protein [Terriglobales bacterium]
MRSFPRRLSTQLTRLSSIALLAPAMVLAFAVVRPAVGLAQTVPTFNTFRSFSTNSGTFLPGATVVGDFNGDGKLDAIVTDGSVNLRLMLGNGDGTFTEHDINLPGTNPGPIFAADLNHDGRLDVVFGNNAGNQDVTVLMNTGNDGGGLPVFSATNYFPGFSGVRSVTVGDLNNDGFPDLIAGGSQGNLQVFLNNGAGGFTTKGPQFFIEPSAGNPSVGPGVIADLNGDGKADYVVTSTQASATDIFIGNGDGTFAFPPTILPGSPFAIAVGDLNQDGKQDLVEGTTDGYVKVYLNNGDGTFSGPASYATDASGPAYQVFSVSLADLNGDGKLDVVAANYFNFVTDDPGNTLAVLVNKGDGTLEASTPYIVDFKPLGVTVGDFTGNGKIDIANVSTNQRSFDLLLNTTKPSLTVAGLSAANKAYDGTNSATISGLPSLVGVSAADAGNVNVTCPATGTFAQASPGNGITVSLATPGCVLSGSAATNYLLTQPAFSANITAPPVQTVVPGTPAGQSSQILLAPVTFSASGTLASISVVTMGATNLDFNQSTGVGSCAVGASYTAGQSCTVAYTFTPTTPGERLGAIVLKNGSGSLLGESFLSGLGQGPVAAYTGAAPVNYATTGQGTVVQVAMDAKGNVFYGNTTGGVSELPATGNGAYGAAQVVIAGGLPTGNFLHGAVFDGAGNLYLADNGHHLMYRIPFVNGSPAGPIQTIIGFSDSPQVLAADGSGNVFAAACCTGNLYRVTPGSSVPTLRATLPGTMTDPEGMVVDAAGNLLISGASGANVLVQVATPATSPSVSSITVSAGSPFALGQDPNGDIYYSDGAGSSASLYRIPNLGGLLQFGAATRVASGYNAPRQILFDRNGNMAVTTSSGHIFVTLQEEPLAQTFPSTNVGSASAPKSLGLTNIGNEPLNFSNLTFDGNFPDQGTTCSVSLAVLGSCNFSLEFRPLAAGNPVTGSLVITDNNLGVDGSIQSGSLSGVGIQNIATVTVATSSITFGDANAALSAQISYTGGVAPTGAVTFTVDGGSAVTATCTGGASPETCAASYAAGSLNAGAHTISAALAADGGYQAAMGTNTLTVAKADQTITFAPLATPVTVNATANLSASASGGGAVGYSVTSGTATISGNTISYTNAGSITVTAAAPATANYNAAPAVSQVITVKPEPVSYSAPETAVGQSTTSQVAYVNFTSGGQLASVSVVTQGASGLDFVGNGGACMIGKTYTAGQACEVNYTFSPKSPGERQGGIVLKAGDGSLLGVSYLGGVGDGPLGLFSSPTASWTATSTGNFAVARGLSVDGAGNVYFASTGAPQGLDEIPAGGNQVVQLVAASIGTGATAVDGAGNVYLASANQAKVFELINGSLVTISSAFQPDDNLEVDGAGNLYTSDYQTGAIYERLAGAPSFTTIIPGSQGHRFIGMAVDPAGDIFAPDFNNNILFEIKAGTNTLTTLASGAPLSHPHAVAVDPAGNLYVANYSGPSNILRYAAGTWQVTSLPALASRSLILDGQGNLYAGTDNTVAEYSRLTPPTLNFPTTVYGQTGTAPSVAFENDGNAPLNISGYAASSNFGANGAGNTCATGSMPVGAACSIVATYTPTAVGNNQTGTLTITDNSADGGTQVLNLEGASTPAALTITASNGSMTYGGAAPAITPIYSGFVNGDSAASLATAPTCTTAATSSSPFGTYASNCSGAADANYTISYVAGSVQVNRAALNITASSGTMIYGGTAPTITAGYSGFVNGDSPASLTTAPTCTTAATSGSAFGTYASNCSGAVDANYTISYIAGSVQVNPAALNITASSGTMTYGGAVPTITAGYSGFVNGDSAASLTTAPTCTTAATSGSASGTYASNCSGAADANYSINYVAGSVQVNPARLAITASSGTMTYGGAAPAITAGYSGFVNGDSAVSLTAAPTCTTAATSSSASGTYASNCSGAADANYSISYVAGSVQVNPAPLAITASSGTMIYGSAAPAITAGYSGFVNGDSAASLTTAPTCTTTASSSSQVLGSPYASSCVGAADANYTISYTGGTVTVTPATAVIRVTPYNLVYDRAAHTAAGTATGVGGANLSADINLSGTVHTDAGSYTDTWSFTDANGNYAPAGGSVTDVINPAQQVITFAPVGPQLYEGNPITITLSAASNGGLPVTFAATGPATVNGNTLTITGVGTVTLTASAPASQDWLAGSATQNVNVTLGMGWGIYATSNTCGAIHLTGRSFVDSYDSAAGAYPARLDQIHGSVGTNGNLRLDGGANIFGALYDPNGNTTGDCDGGHHGDSDDGGTAAVTSLEADGHAKVSGGITTLPAALVFPNPTIPTGIPTTSQALNDDCRNFSGCTVVNDGRGHGHSEIALAPGTYGNVRVDGNVTVDLRAGTYNFNSLQVAGGSLQVTSGPVIVNLAGGQLDRDDAVLDLTHGMIVNSAGPRGLTILYGGRGTLNIAGGSSAAAVIYAPYAAVALNGNGGDQGDNDGDHDDANAGGFSGSIVAATISLNGNTAVHYDRELGNQGVPVAGAGSPPPAAPSDRDGGH